MIQLREVDSRRIRLSVSLTVSLLLSALSICVGGGGVLRNIYLIFSKSHSHTYMYMYMWNACTEKKPTLVYISIIVKYDIFVGCQKPPSEIVRA